MKPKTKRKQPLLPVPTHWIVRHKDSDPPADVLLVVQAIQNDEEDSRPVIELAYWSDKTHQILTLDGNALEENFEVHSYHIVHDIDGEPFEL